MKLFFITFLISCCFSANSQSKLQFNGYYYHFDNDHKDSSWHYLRFYPDGSVVETNSIARPGKLMKGFRKNAHPDLFQGTYTLKGDEITFSTFDKRKQKVVYKGKVENGKLILRMHSFATGYQADEVYEFVPVKGIN